MSGENIQGENVNLAEVFGNAWQRQMRNFQTAFPGRVTQDWDPNTLTVEVEPQFYETWRADETRISRQIPPIPNVPLVFQGSGEFGATFPVLKDSTVLVICTKYAIDRWLDQAQAGDPGDMRKFTLAGATAIPGLYSNPGSDAIKALHNATDYVIKSANLIQLGDPAATDFLALKKDVDDIKAELDKIETTFGSIVFTVDTAGGTGTPGVIGTAYANGYTVTASTKGKAE